MFAILAVNGSNQEGSEIPAESILCMHVAFGLLGVLAAVWVFVELLNASANNSARAFKASLMTSAFMWMSFLSGGYWYVKFYAAEKALALAGPRPWAHTVGMESKEHLFFVILLLATYLPVLMRDPGLNVKKSIKRLGLVAAGSIVVLGLMMERLGAIVSLGVRMGLGK